MSTEGSATTGQDIQVLESLIKDGLLVDLAVLLLDFSQTVFLDHPTCLYVTSCNVQSVELDVDEGVCDLNVHIENIADQLPLFVYYN